MQGSAGMSGAEAYEAAVPGAAALIESLRSVGYNLPTAIADLIDNSIAAGAKNVWLQFTWDGAGSWFTLRDDGRGMTTNDLVNAMTPGSKSPLETRSDEDLGRFGLGLKTASFSQCRELTVSARTTNGAVSTRRWDLDYVQRTNEWRLLKEPGADGADRLAGLAETKSGTVILWEKMDRVVRTSDAADEKAHKRFRSDIERVGQHLGMVFHNFIAEGRLRILLNGTTTHHLVKPWDPFHPEADRRALPGAKYGGVNIKGYVLPHRDRLSEDEFKKAGGASGWNAQQGFYVYRGGRLLVSGGWLDLGYTNEEPYRLARIRVDIPTSADADWDIDIKKSRARPPGELRDQLKSYADNVRRQAREVYAHRGAWGKGPKQEALERPWQVVQTAQRTTYRINREHVLLKSLLTATSGPALEAALRLIEETVPVERIWLDATEKTAQPSPANDDADRTAMLQMMKQLRAALLSQGATPEGAVARLRTMEPFHRYPDLLASLD